MAILHQKNSDFLATAKMLIYPDGARKIIAANKPIFGGAGWELSDKWDCNSRQTRPKKDKPSAADLERSRRRAAAKLRDYALCTPFKWFVTLTLSAEKVDRYDMGAVIKKMRTWLDNRVRRKGLCYLLVPELHKDGAVHFHGFFNDAPLDYVDSGTLKVDGKKAPIRPRGLIHKAELLKSGAKPVYNLVDWDFGFTTAIEIYGDYRAAIGYVSKYVSKQNEKIGGRWYFSGGELRLPDEVLIPDLDYWQLREQGAFCFDLERANLALAILEVKV